MAKILYLENGMSNDAASGLVPHSLDRRPMHQLSRLNLLIYDVIVVPSYSNQDLLKANWHRLVRFVRYGGALVVLAGTQDKTPWLDFCVFQPAYAQVEEYQILNENTEGAKTILRDVPNLAALTFHDGFFSHGSFLAEPTTTVSIVTERVDPRRAVLAILSPTGLSGKLLVTTLDADYHATAGHTRKGSAHNIYAEQLFRNIVEWAVQFSESRGEHERWTRRVLGWSGASIRNIGLITTTLITFCAFVAWTIGVISSESLGIVGSIASLLGLAFAVIQWSHGRR